MKPKARRPNVAYHVVLHGPRQLVHDSIILVMMMDLLAVVIGQAA